jgi:thymidylate synthase ThyX
MKIDELQHVSAGNPTNGPFVLVLQDGALITAEDGAMLQSLYSRSPASVLDHLEKLSETGSGKFMEQYYVGYGHKSIGDCGNTTIFIERVSMLAAKAIQDSMLYDGQEVSTRFLDFATQPFINPFGFTKDLNPQEDLRCFYVKALPLVKEDLKAKYPKQKHEKDSVYEKAIAARAFDILRGFLPAGTETNLSWTTNLRQAADKLTFLRVHPLEEVRRIADMIAEVLQKAHPSSFVHKQYEASNSYRKMYMEEVYYFHPVNIPSFVTMTKNSLDKELFSFYRNQINLRPEKTELPKHLGEIGTLQFEFTLDFGSFRDIARHRAVIQRMPVLTTDFGFHEWYLDGLPLPLRNEAFDLLTMVKLWWNELLDEVHDEKFKVYLQYYLPMGYRVPCRITGDLPALVYLVELRSGVTVHPTLRKIAQDMGKIIESLGVSIYIDRSEIGRFDVKRGNQDIVMK